MDVLIHPRLPAPLRSQPKPESIMLFRNDETKEEREAREDIFGSKLSAPADEVPIMEVDRPSTPTYNVPLIPPNQGPFIQEPRKIPPPSLESIQPTAHSAGAPVKLFGMGTNFSTSLSDPRADPPVVSSTPTASALESHEAPISSTPLIRTVPSVPSVPSPMPSASGGPTSASAVPSVWQGAAADEDEAEDEEMPEINTESDSE